MFLRCEPLKEKCSKWITTDECNGYSRGYSFDEKINARENSEPYYFFKTIWSSLMKQERQIREPCIHYEAILNNIT